MSALHYPALTQAVGLAGLFMAVGITAFGIFMHNESNSSDSASTPRSIGMLGSLGLSAQVLMAYALHRQLDGLLYFAAALVGIGSGALYVVSIVLLQEWAPESTGFITGTGLLVGGAGSLFGITAFQSLITAMGPIPAMAFSGCIAGAISAISSLLLQRPPPGWSPMTETPFDDYEVAACKPLKGCSDPEFLSEGQEKEEFTSVPMLSDEAQSLLSHKRTDLLQVTRLSIRDMLGDLSFSFLFISVAAAAGPGFGFVLAFPRMLNTLFQVGTVTANNLFFWVTLVGVIGRFLVGIAIDLLQSPSDVFGNGFDGAKQLNIVLLALQCFALAAMPICITNEFMYMFAVATGLVFVTFSGGVVICACLARSIFSPENATLAMALLAIASGIGRALFSMLIAACGPKVMEDSVSIAVDRLREYDPFVQGAFLVSVIGLICSYYVYPSKAIYQNRGNTPVFSDLQV